MMVLGLAKLEGHKPRREIPEVTPLGNKQDW